MKMKRQIKTQTSETSKKELLFFAEDAKLSWTRENGRFL